MPRLSTHIYGRRIKAALALADRDGTWLAREMGMSRTYLSTLMNAGRLDGAQLVTIAQLTGVSVDWLRGGGPSVSVLENATAPDRAELVRTGLTGERPAMDLARQAGLSGKRFRRGGQR